MGYEIAKITLSVDNNYIRITSESVVPKGEVGAPKVLICFMPKPTTNFTYNYALVNDPKLGEIWSVTSVEIFSGDGRNKLYIQNSDILGAKVYIDVESTDLLQLTTFLTKNTGV